MNALPLGTEHMVSSLAVLRSQIEDVDERVIALIAERMAMAMEIGRLKGAMNKPVVDPPREAAVVARATVLARDHGLPEDEIRALYWQLVAMSRRSQVREAYQPFR